MIVHDAPAFRQALEDQGETTVWMIVCAVQSPAAEHDGRIR